MAKKELEASQAQTCSEGWTCNVCGRWVLYGEFHLCSNYPRYPQYPQYNTTDRSQEIIDLLKEILDELRKKD